MIRLIADLNGRPADTNRWVVMAEAYVTARLAITEIMAAR